MTATPPDPATIAAGLTRDMREVLMRFDPPGVTLALRLARRPGFDAIKQAKLVNVRVCMPDTLGWFLTPRGCAVRAALADAPVPGDVA